MDVSINSGGAYGATSVPTVSAPAAGTPVTPAADVSVAPAQAAAPQPVAASTPQDLKKAVDDIAAFVDSSKRNLSFSIDDTTHKVVVKVVATDTGEVVLQLPTEAALKIAQSMADPNSVLFDDKA